MLHDRCHDFEKALRSQIDDLREQLSRAHDLLETQQSEHTAQISGLLDRILALSNPAAARALIARNPALASTEPTPAMPTIPRSPSPVPSRVVMPGGRLRPHPKRPPEPLHPVKIDYAAVIKQRAEARAAAQAQAQSANASATGAQVIVDPDLASDTENEDEVGQVELS